MEIDPVSARKWQRASVEKRQKLSDSFARIISRTLDERDDDFWEFVKELRIEAEKNGLTEEILNDILNSES